MTEEKLKEDRFVSKFTLSPKPSKDFVTEYSLWTSKMTDAPQEHQILASLVALAAVIGAVKLDWKQGCLPNVQVVLLGRTYLDRKTGGTLRCFKEVIPPELILQATDFSPESIQSLLQAHNGEGLLPIDEWGLFVRDFKKKEFMAGMPRLMIKWYDSVPLLKKTYSNPVHIDCPFVNVLCLSTRETVVENIGKYDITNGLVGRQIHCYAERHEYLDPSEATAEDEAKANELRKWLKDLYEHRVKKAKFSPEAEKLLKDYKRKIDDELQEKRDEVYSAVVGRYSGDYSVKFSLLYQFSEEDPKHVPEPIVIGETAVRRAIALVEQCIQNCMKEVVFYVISNTTEKVYKIMEDEADSEGWVHRGKVMRKGKLSKEDMDKIRDTLEDEGDILVEETEPTMKGGRRGERYKPVRALKEGIRKRIKLEEEK